MRASCGELPSLCSDPASLRTVGLAMSLALNLLDRSATSSCAARRARPADPAGELPGRYAIGDTAMTSISTIKLRRRSVLKGLVATAALGGFPHVRRATAAEAIEQSSFEIAGVRDPQLGAQLAIAEHYGYFKDAGLTVTIHWNQSAADTLTVMAGGSQPVGVGGAFTQIVFSGQKLPIRIISALADIAPTQGFALAPGVKLSSPKELEGKKLAWTQGNSQILILAKLAKVYGFDMKKVTLVSMNPAEGVVAASKGDVDGLLGWQPNLYRLIQ